MPPTFAYIIAFMMYTVASVSVLLASCGMMAFSSTRLTGIRVATGALFSLPGMLIFQVVSLPFVVLALLPAAVFFSVIDPNEGWQVMVGIPILLLAIGVFAAASAYGIYFGYRTAWSVCGGTPWRTAVRSDKIVGMFFRALKPQPKNG